LTQTDKFGVMSASKRGVTLNEIRFEKPGSNLGGGLIYSLDGRLVGILGATLQVAPNPATANKPTGVGGNLKGVGGDNRGSNFGAVGGGFGPGQMTVAYSISADILGRVIEGFLSPSHKVVHPAIGIFASDAPNNGGALITSITKGSPADTAGIKPGDIVVRLGDNGVVQAVDIIRFMNHQEVGATVTIVAKRGEEILNFSVKIGGSG
jgi:S1-C subfamily serine protease